MQVTTIINLMFVKKHHNLYDIFLINTTLKKADTNKFEPFAPIWFTHLVEAQILSIFPSIPDHYLDNFKH